MTNALDQTVRFDRLADGQALNVHLPDGSSEAFEYDALGLVVQHRDRAGHMRGWQRNSRGQPVVAEDANERKLRYETTHEAAPWCCKAAMWTRPRPTALATTPGDRLVTELRPYGMDRRLSYGAFGQVLEERWLGTAIGPQGERPERSTSFTRDPMARLLVRSQGDSRCHLCLERQRFPFSQWKCSSPPKQAQPLASMPPSGQLHLRHGGSPPGRAEVVDGTCALRAGSSSTTFRLLVAARTASASTPEATAQATCTKCAAATGLAADIERDELHREVLRTQGRLTSGLGL